MKTAKIFEYIPYDNFNTIFDINPISDIGDKMSVFDFISILINGDINDFDGYCTFLITLDNQKYEIADISYSIAADSVSVHGDEDNYISLIDLLRFTKIREVIWYNK